MVVVGIGSFSKRVEEWMGVFFRSLIHAYVMFALHGVRAHAYFTYMALMHIFVSHGVHAPHHKAITQRSRTVVTIVVQ